MTAPPSEQEIIQLEERYWTALRDQDGETAARLSGDPCIVTGASGVATLPRQQLKAMMEDPSWELKDFALSDFQIQVLTDDVVVVAYRVEEELVVDGSPLTLKAVDASTWARQGEDWVCALHTESILGDAFGRDRLSEANAKG
jgi:hypothetical protein